MNTSTLKQKIVTGSAWSLIGFISSTVVTFTSNIWLAILLTPKEFGQISIILFFIGVGNVLSESGLSGALIRKENASTIDYSTIFVFNLTISFTLLAMTFVFSGNISQYYNDPSLKWPLNISSLILIINALQFTQNTRLLASMKFKARSIYNILSVSLSSIIGIYSAYMGLGLWALVLMYLSRSLINAIILWIAEGFIPKFKFSFISFKSFYGFGVNTTLVSILNMTFDNINQLVLAKHFSILETGFYYQAKKLQDLPGSFMTMLTQGVLYSTLSKKQENKNEFSTIYKSMMIPFISLVGLITVIFFLYSKIIIQVIYGEEWLGSVFYLQLLAVSSFFLIQESFNRVIYKVFNKTRLLLKIEILKKTFQLITILIAIFNKDITLLLIGLIVTNSLGYFTNYYFSRKATGLEGTNEVSTVLKITSLVTLIILASIWSNTDNAGSIFMLSLLPVITLLYFTSLHILGILDVTKIWGLLNREKN